MLSIDERLTVQRLADLKEFRVTVLANQSWIETEHRRERQLSVRRISRRHAHPPARSDKFIVSARAPLVVELCIQNAAVHESPATGVRVNVLLRRDRALQRFSWGRRSYRLLRLGR